MHYTVSTNDQSAINVLSTGERKVSAHLVISRTGEITQLVPFDKQAWHAGDSYWEQQLWINEVAIGIELDSEGVLERVNEQWVFPKDEDIVYPDDQVCEAQHWKEFSKKGWLKFPDVQIQAALEVAMLLKEEYKLVDVLGHEDVHREKIDPGPAFDMEWFRRQMFGRGGAIIDLYETNRSTTIYQEVNFAEKPNIIDPATIFTLPEGTKVKVERRSQNQALIVAKKAGEKIRGWVPEVAVRQKKTTQNVKVLPPINGDKPVFDAPLHRQRSLPEFTKLRIVLLKDELALVATLEGKFIQGWVRRANLDHKGKALYSPVSSWVEPIEE
jgi:N-acetylmuramoyl-L-alanine amidase